MKKIKSKVIVRDVQSDPMKSLTFGMVDQTLNNRIKKKKRAETFLGKVER